MALTFVRSASEQLLPLQCVLRQRLGECYSYDNGWVAMANATLDTIVSNSYNEVRTDSLEEAPHTAPLTCLRLTARHENNILLRGQLPDCRSVAGGS